MRIRCIVCVILVAFCATASRAERAPEDRDTATHVVVGSVEGVYSRVEKDFRHYIIEIAVEKVEKGESVKPGSTLYVRCYLRNPDYFKGKKFSEKELKELAFRGSGYDRVPKEGERIKVFARYHGGKYTGVFPNWYEVVKRK